MSGAGILIGIFAVGVLLNAFFAGYETGYVSCNRIRVRHLAEKQGYLNAQQLLRYLDRSDWMLTLVLLGTNLSLLMGTVAITRQVGGYWATIIATPTYLIIGEIVPKSMFRLHPTRLSMALVPVIRVFDRILLPITLPVTWLSRGFLALVHGEEQHEIHRLMRSPEDMRVLVDESADKGTIEPEEKEMIHSVMDLQTSLAKEVMVPRIDIRALPVDASRRELIALLKESGYTRIPIYRESIDEIIGVVNAFDVLRDQTPECEDIQRFLHDILHVHDTMRLDDVLKAMRDAKQSMAIVADEYGGTDGLVTIEDILEEIFGEINDEYDKEEPRVRMVGPNDWVVDARMPLEDAAEAMGLAISDEEVETVGGWVMRLTARIPQKGEVLLHDCYRITVLDGGPNYLSSIRLELVPGSSTAHE